jgi:hypothetical protein
VKKNHDEVLVHVQKILNQELERPISNLELRETHCPACKQYVDTLKLVNETISILKEENVTLRENRAKPNLEIFAYCDSNDSREGE